MAILDTKKKVQCKVYILNKILIFYIVLLNFVVIIILKKYLEKIIIIIYSCQNAL